MNNYLIVYEDLQSNRMGKKIVKSKDENSAIKAAKLNDEKRYEIYTIDQITDYDYNIYHNIEEKEM